VANQRTIEVALGCDEALDLVEASFAAAPTLGAGKQGWTIERRERELLACTEIPWPEAPQQLAVRVRASPLEGGDARVEAKLVWLPRHVVAWLGLGVLSLFEAYGFRLLMVGAEALAKRGDRKAARVRTLRLALEPLIPHQRAAERGPFRLSG
jgi:hypothetical protein